VLPPEHASPIIGVGTRPPPRCPQRCSSGDATLRPEEVVRNACRLEDVVTAVLKFGTKLVDIRIKQSAPPFANLACYQNGIHVAALHKRHDRTRHVITTAPST